MNEYRIDGSKARTEEAEIEADLRDKLAQPGVAAGPNATTPDGRLL